MTRIAIVAAAVGSVDSFASADIVLARRHNLCRFHYSTS
jgi:hypothetical protein